MTVSLAVAQARFATATKIISDLPLGRPLVYQEGYERHSATICEVVPFYHASIARITRIDFADGDYIVFGVVNGMLAVCETDIDEPGTGFLCNVSITRDVSRYHETLRVLREFAYHDKP